MNQLDLKQSRVQTVGKTLWKIRLHPEHKVLPEESEISGLWCAVGNQSNNKLQT